MPDWDDLRVFAAVHREGRLLPAARRLGISVSTAARKLEALERDRAVRLLERGGGAVTPPAAAQRLLARVERIEEQVERAPPEVATTEAARALRLTAPEALGSELLPPLLARFAAAHP